MWLRFSYQRRALPWFDLKCWKSDNSFHLQQNCCSSVIFILSQDTSKFWQQPPVVRLHYFGFQATSQYGILVQSLGNTVMIWSATFNESPRSCHNIFLHEWWRKYRLDQRRTNNDESRRLTNTISDDQVELSRCRTKHKELQRHTTTYRTEMLAMYNEKARIKTQKKFISNGWKTHGNESARPRTMQNEAKKEMKRHHKGRCLSPVFA